MKFRSGFSSAGKLVMAIAGSFLYAFGINMFISGLGLYSGGIMGLSQIIRNLLVRVVDLKGINLAGIIYYIINIPIFILAYRSIGRKFLLKTLMCVTAISLFTTVIPTPVNAIVNDRLVSCLIGGFVSGFGLGLALRSGGSGGGTDIIGLYCIKKNLPVSVGTINLSVNVALYALCMLIFDVETAIYSIIFAVASSIALDKTYSQSINAEVTVISREHGGEIAEAVNSRLVRGVTSWAGKGTYTDRDTQVLYIVLSKYELSGLRALIREIDPHAFVVVKEGVKIEGNYLRKVG